MVRVNFVHSIFKLKSKNNLIKNVCNEQFSFSEIFNLILKMILKMILNQAPESGQWRKTVRARFRLPPKNKTKKKNQIRSGALFKKLFFNLSIRLKIQILSDFVSFQKIKTGQMLGSNIVFDFN